MIHRIRRRRDATGHARGTSRRAFQYVPGRARHARRARTASGRTRGTIRARRRTDRRVEHRSGPARRRSKRARRLGVILLERALSARSGPHARTCGIRHSRAKRPHRTRRTRRLPLFRVIPPRRTLHARVFRRQPLRTVPWDTVRTDTDKTLAFASSVSFPSTAQSTLSPLPSLHAAYTSPHRISIPDNTPPLAHHRRDTRCRRSETPPRVFQKNCTKMAVCPLATQLSSCARALTASART